MADEILRPNGPGDEENITDALGDGVGSHWATVDDVDPDEFVTYVYEPFGTYCRDFYNIVDHSVGSGTINKITVYARCFGYAPTQASLKIAIKAGTGAGAPDTPSESTEKTVAESWVTYSNEWATNPATTNAWTWDEIDNLQAGVALRICASKNSTLCTQVYVVVDYTPGGAVVEGSASASGIGLGIASGQILIPAPVLSGQQIDNIIRLNW